MNISAVTYSPFSTGIGNNSSSISNSQNSSPASSSPVSAKNNPGPDQTGNVKESSTTQENTSPSRENNSAASTDTRMVNGKELTQEQVRVLEQLKQTDSEVRRHEMAHVAAGGRYITSGATFTYQRGPDGRNYAVGGEVSIDTAPVPGDPQATIQKMRQVKNAALAPANPSAQDLKVAAQATTNGAKAMSDLMVIQAEEQAAKNDQKAFGNLKDASNTYEQVNNLPETDNTSIKIAV